MCFCIFVHRFSADERTPVRFVDDDELAFVIQRYRQVWVKLYYHHVHEVGSLMSPSFTGS